MDTNILYRELLKIVEPRMSDFTGYNEETNSFDIVLAVKEIIEDLEDSLERQDSVKTYQEKIEKIKEFINDYGAMQSDADCGLPIGILQIIEGENK